jgi:quinol---cytochrome c reductase iron-sulfur subunit, bacillus type
LATEGKGEEKADRPSADDRLSPSLSVAGAGGDGALAMKPPGWFEGETMTRRRLFTGGAMALGGIAGAAVGLPVIGFALGPVFEEEDVTYQDVGAPGEFSADNYVPKTITLASNIGQAGKSTVYIRKGDPALPGERDGEFIAISTRCAHAGCPVRWVNSAQRFICPCHGGVYDYQGKVAGGPPVRPLDRFVTRVQGGQVQIGPRFSVNSQLKRFSPRDPGERLDGLWKYLYPKRFTTPGV